MVSAASWRAHCETQQCVFDDFAALDDGHYASAFHSCFQRSRYPGIPLVGVRLELKHCKSNSQANRLKRM
jgi:hypothetical protein